MDHYNDLPTALARAREVAAKLQPRLAEFEAEYPTVRDAADYAALAARARFLVLFVSHTDSDPSPEFQKDLLAELVRLQIRELEDACGDLDQFQRLD